MRCTNLRPGSRPLLESRLQNSKFRIQHPESRIQNRDRACGRKCKANIISRLGPARRGSRANRASGAAWILSIVRVLAAHVAGFLCRMAADDEYNASRGCRQCNGDPTASLELTCSHCLKWRPPTCTDESLLECMRKRKNRCGQKTPWHPIATSTELCSECDTHFGDVGRQAARTQDETR